MMREKAIAAIRAAGDDPYDIYEAVLKTLRNPDHDMLENATPEMGGIRYIGKTRQLWQKMIDGAME